MKRVMRGTVLLAVAVGFLGCKGDPTSPLRKGVVKLVATPAVVFVNQGTNENVVVEAVDAQGNRLPADFSLTNVAAGISVVEDTTFNPVYSGDTTLGKAPQTTRVRFVITPPNNLASSFTVSAAGLQIVIPVTVVPTSIITTFSTATPNINDTVTVTAPAGLKFDPASTISFATGGKAITTSVAADSSSFSFVPMVGATGLATITHVVPTYVSGLSISLPATTSITVPSTGRTGTDAIGTAPTLALPAPGTTQVFVDGGPFAANAGCANAAGGTCRLYKMVVGAPTTLTVTATWEATADIGIYFLDAAGTTDVFGDFACDAHGSGATGQPESCTETFAAGTYYLAAVNFSATAPAYFALVIDGQ